MLSAVENKIIKNAPKNLPCIPLSIDHKNGQRIFNKCMCGCSFNFFRILFKNLDNVIFPPVIGK